jgi:hypothetical protein
MPRAIQTKESQVLAFFRTAPMVVAVLVLNLAKEALRERQAIKVPAVQAPKKPAVKAPVKKAKPPVPQPRKRVRPSRAKAAQRAASAHDAQVEDLGGEQG